MATTKIARIARGESANVLDVRVHSQGRRMLGTQVLVEAGRFRD
jgi:hypothetical protein